MKKLLMVGLIFIGQNSFISGNINEMKFLRTLSSEVATGAGATVLCGASIAIAIKNKGAAGPYVGCAALYTALRQAVNVYQMDKEIEEKEKTLVLEAAKKEAESLDLEKHEEKTNQNPKDSSYRKIVMHHVWDFGFNKAEPKK